MIKQPTQPLRFFSSYLEVERDWEKRDKGNPGTHVITEDILFIPPFQIKFDWRGAIIDDFIDGVIELINYNDNTVYDISTHIRAMGVSSYGNYQNFIVYRYPLVYLYPEGIYYLRIADGVPGVTSSHEIWYSEVFKLCDLNRNLLRDVTFTGWDNSQGINVLSTADRYAIIVCESTGNTAYFDMGDFYAITGEPLDFYCTGDAIDFHCGVAGFLPVHFALVDQGGNIISNQIDGILGSIKGILTPTETRPALLRGWIDIFDAGQSEWDLVLVYANPQLYDGQSGTNDELENIGARKVLRWSNSCNICDMIYEEQTGYVKGETGMYHIWVMDYENYIVLDDPPLIPDFAIVENVAEDDSSNKYLLLGNQQEWYYLQLATNQNLAKAIQNIHLHGIVEIDYDGEAHTICENNTEISIGDDHNFTTKFRFREASCPVQSCCFDVCCPNLLSVQDVLATLSALPPADSSNAGLRYLVLVGIYYIYESDGDTWNQLPLLNAEPNCIMDLDAVADGNQTPYMYWDEVNGNWYRIVYIYSVDDETAGVAEINLRNFSKPGLTVIVSWILPVGNARYYSSEFTLAGTASEKLHVTTGADIFDFVLYIWDGDCYYGESNIIRQTIT